ncbi:glucan endo-1,3-beta-glucosidase-like [Zingiber officinale]|uniref:glucan endo-1,3-beta-glucosidase-like n=1 Tax=Zingiber officinale TaxID=94328 RepID=UPI001C4B5858|nr:glucan endo-1,3-beta-glucosidase-like [Zingiber officinale]
MYHKLFFSSRNQSYIPVAVMIAFVALLVSTLIIAPASAQLIGVCYGMQAANLPSPAEVVNLYRSNNIYRMRLYVPDQAVLQALANSGIRLLMDVPMTELQSLATSSSAAMDWVLSNVAAHWPRVTFRYIAVGNEAVPGDLAQHVLPAMRNVHSALVTAGLASHVKVSTAVGAEVLESSFPPSAGAFSTDASTFLSPIAAFLANTSSPLLVNAYPYFVYADNSAQVSLSYALMNETGTVVQDGEFAYTNLFDAMIDSVHAALKREGVQQLAVVVSESGWPTAGGYGASVLNAQTYIKNLIRHVGR